MLLGYHPLVAVSHQRHGLPCTDASYHRDVIDLVEQRREQRLTGTGNFARVPLRDHRRYSHRRGQQYQYQ